MISKVREKSLDHTRKQQLPVKVSNGLVRSMSPQVPVRLPNLSPDPMTGTNVATMEEIDVDGLSVKRMTLPQK